MLSECSDAIWGKIKRIRFFWRHGDSRPDVEASSARCGKDVVAIPYQLVDVLKGLIDDFRVDHEGFCFRIDDFEHTLLVISWLFGVLFFIVGDGGLIFVKINKGKECFPWTKLIFAEIISADIEPVQNIFVLFFMMIDLLLKLIQVSVEAEQQFFGVEEVDWLFDVIMSGPLAIFEVLHEDIVVFLWVEVSLRLFVVRFPIF